MKMKTKGEILSVWEKVCKDPDRIYHNGRRIFNYKGRLKDIDDLSVEYISQLAFQDFHVLKSIGKNDSIIRRTKSFNLQHTGISNDINRRKRFGEIWFNEKPFAIALYNSNHRFPFGKIFDYEVPLRENRNSKIGNIDLVSLLNNEIFVIELKVESSKASKTNESLLTAIMEAYSFSIFLNIRKSKFALDMGINNLSSIRPAILTLKDSLCEEQMKMLRKNQLPNLKRLILNMNAHLAKLGISAFKFYSIVAKRPNLIKDEGGRTIVEDSSFFDSEIVDCSLSPSSNSG